MDEVRLSGLMIGCELHSKFKEISLIIEKYNCNIQKCNIEKGIIQKNNILFRRGFVLIGLGKEY